MPTLAWACLRALSGHPLAVRGKDSLSSRNNPVPGRSYSIALAQILSHRRSQPLRGDNRSDAVRLAMADLAADNLIGYLVHGKPLTPLNPQVLARA